MNYFRTLLISVLFALPLLAFVQTTYAATSTQQIAYSWTASTTRVDGSALSAAEIAGYEIYYTIDGGATGTIKVGGAALTATQNLALAPKAAGYTLVAAMSTIDTAGLKSALSEPVTVKLTVASALPAPPSNIKLSVNCTNGSCSLIVQ